MYDYTKWVLYFQLNVSASVLNKSEMNQLPPK